MGSTYRSLPRYAVPQEYEEPGDDVAQEALRPEAYNGRQQEAPAIPGSTLRRKMLKTKSATMIKMTYLRVVRTSVTAVSWRFMR